MRTRSAAVLAVVAAALSVTAAASGEGLRLVATLVVDPDPGGRSRAIIEDASGRQALVAPGQTIAGCRLTTVTPGDARLRCGEKWTRIVRTGSAFRQTATPPELRTDHYQRPLPRATLAAALRDRQRLVSQVSLEPALRAGFLRGYRIAWLRQDGALGALGLRDGDVVLGVNGVPVAAPGIFAQAVDALRDTHSFTLTIERDGERADYEYLLM